MFKNGQCFTEFNLTKAVYERFDDASYMHINYIRCCTGMHRYSKI